MATKKARTKRVSREEEDNRFEEESVDDYLDADEGSENEEEPDSGDEEEEEEEEEPRPKKRRSRSRKAKVEEPDAEEEEVADELEDPEFTPEQVLKVNDFVEKRLARDRKNQKRRFDRQLRTEKTRWTSEQTEQRKRQEMAETDRLKAEKEDAEHRANERVMAANRRVVLSEAKQIATELGVSETKKRKRLFKMVDLAEVEVDDGGEPDYEAIEEAIKDVLQDVPELLHRPEVKASSVSRDSEEALAERVTHARDSSGAVGGGGNPPRGTESGQIDYRNRPMEEVQEALAKYGLRPRTPGTNRRAR